jgi:hypothetical protein
MGSTIIIQRVKDLKINGDIVENSLLIFIPAEQQIATLSLFTKKLTKLKLWDGWTKNLTEMEAIPCFILKNGNHRQLVEFKLKAENIKYYLMDSESELQYKNDGPCTFIFSQ